LSTTRLIVSQRPPHIHNRFQLCYGVTVLAYGRDNLTEGSSVDDQLEFMQDKCSQAARLLGLHKKARQVQPREYIAGNKRVMSVDLMARKRQALEQQQPAMIAAS